MRVYLKIAAAIVLMLAFAGVVQAELSAVYANWAEGPAGFLLTKDELKQWKKIENDADAKHFIELFWARRNPNPDQPFNEFKAQFDARVRYADENFSYEKSGDVQVKGSLSDRAKVMILMGVPQQAEHRGPTETVQSVGTAIGQTGMGSDEVRSNAIMWSYDPARLPEGFNIKGTRVLFVFYEERTGSNNFVLDRSHQEATMAMRALSKAPEVYLLHPELTEISRPVSVPGGTQATAEQLAWLAKKDAPFNEQSFFEVEPGVADASHRPIWFHVTLPADAPVLDLLCGRLVSPDGEILSTFQSAAAPLEVKDGRAYHLTFPVADGQYRVEVAGVGNGEPQFTYSEMVEVPGIPLEGAWLSPLWVGLQAIREDGAPLGAPFTFAGWHLIPLSDAPQSKNNELSYFGFVVRPQLGEDGKPSINAKIVLKQDGKRLGAPLRMPLPAAKVTGDLYMYANSLQLAPFPVPAQYVLEFTVEDSLANVETKRTVELGLTE